MTSVLVFASWITLWGTIICYGDAHKHTQEAYREAHMVMNRAAGPNQGELITPNSHNELGILSSSSVGNRGLQP